MTGYTKSIMTNRLCVWAVMAVALAPGADEFHAFGGRQDSGGPQNDIGDDIDDTWCLVMLLRSPNSRRQARQYDLRQGGVSCQNDCKAARRWPGGPDVAVGLGEGGRDGAGGQQTWVKDYKLTDYPGKIHQDGAGAHIDLIEHSSVPITLISIGPLNTTPCAAERPT